MPPYLLSQSEFSLFLQRFLNAELPKSEWNHGAHLSIAAATLHSGGSASDIRNRILAYNARHGIETTPDSGYHETITCFWVERINDLLAALGRGATDWDAARAAVATFAHRGRLFDAYYSYDIVKSREARAAFQLPDIPPAA